MRHEREARDESQRQLAEQRDREAADRSRARRTRGSPPCLRVLMLLLRRRCFRLDQPRARASRDHRGAAGAQRRREACRVPDRGLLCGAGAHWPASIRWENWRIRPLHYYDGLPPELITPQTQVYRGMALIREGGAQLAGTRRQGPAPGTSRRPGAVRTAASQTAIRARRSRSVWRSPCWRRSTPGAPAEPRVRSRPTCRWLRPCRPLATRPARRGGGRSLCRHPQSPEPRAPKAAGRSRSARRRADPLRSGGARPPDLKAPSVSGHADSQARTRWPRAARGGRATRAQVYDSRRAVLAQRPGDLRSMNNRALAADLLGGSPCGRRLRGRIRSLCSALRSRPATTSCASTRAT